MPYGVPPSPEISTKNGQKRTAGGPFDREVFERYARNAALDGCPLSAACEVAKIDGKWTVVRASNGQPFRPQEEPAVPDYMQRVRRA
jgi:hypothetical protein